MYQAISDKKLKLRTVWISDVHLGYRGCKADYLLDFLRHVECEKLYLVGDIVDLWSMKKQRGLYWPQQHNNVIRTILGKAKHDTEVIFIPGNHDEEFRDYFGMDFGNITIKQDDIHTTFEGKKLKVLHGDIFDSVIRCNALLKLIGNWGYDLLLFLNRAVHRLRNRLGLDYWSLSAFLKKRIGNAMKHIHHYEKAAFHLVRQEGLDGIVCGHIHHANIRKSVDGLLYLNDGDWVESCTAMAETADGKIQLIHWAESQRIVREISLSDSGTNAQPLNLDKGIDKGIDKDSEKAA